MTLKDRVEETLIKAGTRETLADEAGVALETIRRVLKGQFPRPKTAYKLAKACGCSDEEALAIAKQRPSGRAKKAS